MASEWPLAPVKELADVTDFVANGSFASLRENVEYLDAPGHAVLIRLVDFKSHWSAPFVYVDEAAFRFLRKSRLEAGDIVISNVGANAGTVFTVPRLGIPMTLGPNAICVKPVGNKQFFYYYFSSPQGQAQLRSIISGSAQPKFNKTDFRRLMIPNPHRRTQDSIAGILATLDDKIELSRRMNETLEATARSLFQYWCIPKPSERWTSARIYDFADVFYGAPYKSSLFREGGAGLPLIRIRDLEQQNPSTFTTERHPRDCMIQPGDLIVGMDGEFRAHLWRGPRALLNQRLCCFRPKPGFSRAFLHYSIETTLDFFERSKTGTTVIHLGKSDIDTFRIATPPKANLQAFARASDPIDQRMIHSATEMRALTNIRESLLPKLISGEIRLKDAERFAARHV
jgi:type I restriction enzyme, S subunit